MRDPKHPLLSENQQRHARSLALDFIYNATGCSIPTSKHLALGHGIHSVSGQKTLVNIVHKLGHCITYRTVMDLETTHTSNVVETMKNVNTNSSLPLAQKDSKSRVKTVFWVDNFDKVNHFFTTLM